MRGTLRLGVALAACAALGLSGCGGEPRVIVRGKLTQKGQPLQAAKRKAGNLPGMMIGDQLQKMDAPTLEQMAGPSIVYYPVTPSGATDKQAEFFWGHVNPEGRYEVLGKDGKGIPPGKYRVSVIWPAAFTNEDRLKGAFGPDNSRILRDVAATPREQEFDFDLAKPEG